MFSKNPVVIVIYRNILEKGLRYFLLKSSFKDFKFPPIQMMEIYCTVVVFASVSRENVEPFAFQLAIPYYSSSRGYRDWDGFPAPITSFLPLSVWLYVVCHTLYIRLLESVIFTPYISLVDSLVRLQTYSYHRFQIGRMSVFRLSG